MKRAISTNTSSQSSSGVGFAIDAAGGPVVGTPYARQHLQNIAKANKSQRENTEFCGALCRIWEVCPEPLREMGGNSFREIILSLRGGAHFATPSPRSRCAVYHYSRLIGLQQKNIAGRFALSVFPFICTEYVPVINETSTYDVVSA